MLISSSIMLRMAFRSVPSTARFRAFLRKSSGMVSASCSSDTMPCLRALAAKRIISSNASFAAGAVSKKTKLSLRAERIRTSIGVLTMMAPRVPPKTMTAAVIWATSLIRPPSSNKPPRMPPAASARPPILAKSGLAAAARRFAWGGSAILADILPSSQVLPAIVRFRHRTREQAAVDRSPERRYTFHNLDGGFQNHDLLPGCQRNHGVGCNLNVLNQIRVEDHRYLIEARQ